MEVQMTDADVSEALAPSTSAGGTGSCRRLRLGEHVSEGHGAGGCTGMVAEMARASAAMLDATTPTPAFPGVIYTPHVRSSHGIAVTPNGESLIVCDTIGGSHTVCAYGVRDGSLQRSSGGPTSGNGPGQFNKPAQVCVSDDCLVFVADSGNNRVQVLTSDLSFRGVIGEGQLGRPHGVCADRNVVVVTELSTHRITVFSRADGGAIRRIGTPGAGDGDLSCPLAVCFTSEGRGVAVAEAGNSRVSVFQLDGVFVRHVGVGVLNRPYGVTATSVDELVVCDRDSSRVLLFSAIGELLYTFGSGMVTGACAWGGLVFVQQDSDTDSSERCCTLYSH
jgi:DNA-binding beta-propeller fold protein YncE